MASDQTLRAIITVLDRTAAPFRAINERIERLGAPIRHIGDRLTALAEETGLRSVGEHARDALEHVHHLGEGLLELAGPLAALGAAGSVAGLVELAKSTFEFEGKLYDASIATGIAGQQLAGLHYAASLAHVDVERLDRGFTYLNRNIALAAQGKAKDVEQILGRMGFHNKQGHLVQTADALHAVAKEAQHLVDSGQTEQATAMLSKLFGARAGAQLLPLFSQGDAKIAEQVMDAIQLGAAPTNEAIKAGKEFDDRYRAMGAAVDGLKYAIGNELFPVLQDTVTDTTKWIAANRGWIATNIGGAVRDFATWVRSINFTAVIEGLKEFRDWARWVVDELGGVGHVLEIVAAIKLAPAILAFGELGLAIGGAGAKLLIFPVAEFLVTLATLVPAIDGVSGAMAAFDLALDANPIGAVILAVTALGLAGYWLYEHWEAVSGFFRDLWNGMPEWAQIAVQAIGAAIAPFIAIPLEIYAHWDQLKPYFETLWSGVEAVFRGAWEIIRPIVDKIRDAIGWIIDHAPSLNVPGYTDPETGGFVPQAALPGTRTPLTQLPGGAGASGAPVQKSENKVDVTFHNTPPGTTVSSETKGDTDLGLNVGHAMAY